MGALGALFVLVALLPLAPGQASKLVAASTTGEYVAVTGILAVGIVHNQGDGSSSYWLELMPAGANSALRVDLGTPLKASDLGEGFYTGARATVTGQLTQGGHAIRVASLQDVVLVLGPSPLGVALQPETQFRVLTLVVNLECIPVEEHITKRAIRIMQRQLAGTWRMCSFGKLHLVAERRILRLTVPCVAPYNGRDCHEQSLDAFRAAADEHARSRGVEPLEFPYLAYVYPPSDSCKWSARGMLRCRGQGDGYPCTSEYVRRRTDVGIYLHEFGHNLGMEHAMIQGSANEYSGPTDPMGDPNRYCYNAPHLHQMGWIQPTALDSTDLQPGRIRQLTLMSTSLSADSAVRINPDWVGGHEPAVYLSFLTPHRGNRRMPAGHRFRTSLYRFHAPSFAEGSIERTRFVESLQSRNYYVFQAPLNLVVRQDRVVKLRDRRPMRQSAKLRVCRYAAHVSECSRLTGGVPPVLPSPSPAMEARVKWWVSLFADKYWQRHMGNIQEFWNPTDGATVYGVPDLRKDVSQDITKYQKRVSCLAFDMEASGAASAVATMSGTTLVFYDGVDYSGRAWVQKFDSNSAALHCPTVQGGKKCAMYYPTLAEDWDNTFYSFQLFLGGAEFTPPAVAALAGSTDGVAVSYFAGAAPAVLTDDVADDVSRLLEEAAANAVTIEAVRMPA